MPSVEFTIDGKEIKAEAGQTILEAAEASGVYIPRLCHKPGLTPYGSCRVCTVLVNGRPQSACTQPASPGAVVENDTPKMNELRLRIVEMLFVEGNHFCMFCEKSGACELQALGYRLGMTAPRYPFQFPQRVVDASHPGIYLDRNRCVLCARCVRASRDLDHKHVFDFVNRGARKSLAVDSPAGLGATSAAVDDAAAEACPVGCIIRKRVGYAVPIGAREFDHEPIGSEIERAGTK